MIPTMYFTADFPSASSRPRKGGTQGTFSATLLVVALAACLSSAPARAALVGSDDFNDDSMDVTKWSAPSMWQHGEGVVETGGHLVFTNLEGAYSQQLWQWELNQARYDEDWSLQVDTSLGSVDNTGVTSRVLVGISIMDPAEMNQLSAIQVMLGTSSSGQRYFSSLVTDPVPPGYIESLSVTTSQAGAVRVSYSAVTQTLTSWYDADGSTGGYSWVILQSRSINAGGSAWGMSGSDLFKVQIWGAVSNIAVGEGDGLYLDNFVAVPEPATFGVLAGLTVLGLALWRRRRA